MTGLVRTLFPVLAVLVLVVPLSLSIAAPISQQTEDVYRVTVSGQFDEYRELLELAISNRGIKISSISHISDMLQRTKSAVASTGDSTADIYTHAEAIEFCSARLSRQMMTANAHNITYCPYIIYIYELATRPGKIHLAFRQLPVQGSRESREVLTKINALLKAILAEVVD